MINLKDIDKEYCLICKKLCEDGDNEIWTEEKKQLYHLDCIRAREGQGKPFMKKYTGQKRISKTQVLEVFDLLNDNEFLEYWIQVIACNNEDEIEELYDHPILKDYDLFP